MNMRKKGIVIIGLLLFSLGIQNTIAQESAYVADHLRSFKDGKTLYSLGTYAAAQDQLYTFLNATKNFSTPEYKRLRMEAEFLIAQSALRLGQSNAEKLLLSFVKNYKPDPYTHKAIREVASYYYNLKEYDKALTYLKEIDLYSIPKGERTEVRFKMGYSELVLKNFTAARTHFQLIKNEEGIYYYPSNYYLAMSQYFLENYTEALKGFQSVEKSRRYRKVVPYYISHIYYLQKRYEELIPLAEKSLKESDIQYRTEIEYLLGQAYFSQGDYKKALPLLEKQAQYSTRPDDTYQLAFTYYKNNKYEQAIKQFKKITDEEGEMGQNANFYLATSYIHLGNKADARVAFASAYRKHYNDKITEEALFNYGKISAELQYDREAVNALQEIPAASSFYKESQQVLSDVFYNTRDYARSIEILEDMGSLSPELKRAYQRTTLNYGLQKLKNNEVEDALNNFDKSLLYPINSADRMQVLYWKAYIYHQEESYSESIRLLNDYFTLSRDESIQLPTNISEAPARYMQGYNYFKNNNYALASGQFGRAISLIDLEGTGEDSYLQRKILPDALVRQGDCLFKENKYNEAVVQYDRAIDKGYSTPSYPLYQKAIIKGLVKSDAEKILYLSKVVENYPNAPYTDQALLELGRTYQALEQYNQAIPYLQKLVEEYKGKSSLINVGLISLGLISYNQGDTREALRYYKQVVENNPDKVTKEEALTAIKEIYIQDIGKPGEYVSYLEKVEGTKIGTSTKDSLTFRSANLAFESGNYEKAIANFTEYIKTFPSGAYKTEAHYYRAESLAVLQNYKDALGDYELVATRGPGRYYLPALEKAAKIAYNSTQDFAKAARYYDILEENALSEDKRLEALVSGIEASYRNGNSEAVVRKAQRISGNAHASESNIAKAQFYLGKTSMKQQQYDRALNAFNQVMQYSDDEKAAEARYSIAYIYFLRKEFPLAQDLAEKAYKESTAYPYWVAKSLILLADVLVIDEDYYNARAAVEAVIENYKDDADILKQANERLKTIHDYQQKNKQNSTNDLLEMDEN